MVGLGGSNEMDSNEMKCNESGVGVNEQERMDGVGRGKMCDKNGRKNANVDEKKNLLRNEKAKIVVGPTK